MYMSGSFVIQLCKYYWIIYYMTSNRKTIKSIWSIFGLKRIIVEITTYSDFQIDETTHSVQNLSGHIFKYF